MNSQIKKYFSLFFLFLFLFPMVEKEIHALEHKADIHCSATDKHFHSLEHNCSVCDFTNTNTITTPETSSEFIISANDFSFLPFIESSFTSSSFHLLPARAPPIVC